MNKKVGFLIAALLTTVVLLGCAPKTPAGKPSDQTSAPAVSDKAITAKQAYEIAEPEARKEMSDAQPISISGRPDRETLDGKSERWLVNYGKPDTTTNNFRVIIQDGKFQQIGTFQFMTKPRPEQFSGTWIDSTKAAEVATANGAKCTYIEYELGYIEEGKLAGYSNPKISSVLKSLERKFVWEIYCGGDYYFIDAVTGQFLDKVIP